MSGQPGFFDIEERYEALSRAGDPLEKLEKMIPWNKFRYLLKNALQRKDRSNGGRPPFDDVLMFKILVLQALFRGLFRYVNRPCVFPALNPLS